MKKIITLLVILFPFSVNACGESPSPSSFGILIVPGVVILIFLLVLFFVKINKIVTTVLFAPFLLYSLIISYESIKTVERAEGELPSGSYLPVLQNLLPYCMGIFFLVGLFGVIVNLVLLIIFRKSEKKVSIKRMLLTFLVAMIVGVCGYVLLTATQQTLCDFDHSDFDRSNFY